MLEKIIKSSIIIIMLNAHTDFLYIIYYELHKKNLSLIITKVSNNFPCLTVVCALSRMIFLK